MRMMRLRLFRQKKSLYRKITKEYMTQNYQYRSMGISVPSNNEGRVAISIKADSWHAIIDFHSMHTLGMLLIIVCSMFILSSFCNTGT